MLEGKVGAKVQNIRKTVQANNTSTNMAGIKSRCLPYFMKILIPLLTFLTLLAFLTLLTLILPILRIPIFIVNVYCPYLV